MKRTYIETWQNGVQLLGSDYTSIVKNIDTRRKLDNAINKHIARLKGLEQVHPNLKDGNIQLKYHTID